MVTDHTYLLDASISVPHVSAMSSTNIAVLPLTSPTSTIPATSLANFLYRNTGAFTLPPFSLPLSLSLPLLPLSLSFFQNYFFVNESKSGL